MPLSVCTSEEAGILELSGGSGYRWPLPEQKEGVNQRRSAPQLEPGADGSEAGRRDTSQFLSM